MPKKKEINLSFMGAYSSAFDIHCFFRCSHCDQSGMFFYRLEYGPIVYTRI